MDNALKSGDRSKIVKAGAALNQALANTASNEIEERLKTELDLLVSNPDLLPSEREIFTYWKNRIALYKSFLIVEDNDKQ